MKTGDIGTGKLWGSITHIVYMAMHKNANGLNTNSSRHLAGL